MQDNWHQRSAFLQHFDFLPHITVKNSTFWSFYKIWPIVTNFSQMEGNQLIRYLLVNKWCIAKMYTYCDIIYWRICKMPEVYMWCICVVYSICAFHRDILAWHQKRKTKCSYIGHILRFGTFFHFHMVSKVYTLFTSLKTKFECKKCSR